MIPAHIDRFYFNRKLGKSWKDPSRKKLDLGTTLRCDGAGLSSAGAEGGGVFEGVVIFVTKKCEDSKEEVSKIDSILRKLIRAKVTKTHVLGSCSTSV